MQKISFELIDKISLTHDVYKLIYQIHETITVLPKPGQYVMFQLAPGLNRSYSLSEFDEHTQRFTLIIKKIPEGKGSSIICDAQRGDIFQGLFPLGHFILNENICNKCFIGTGTGFAPLFFQIEHAIKQNLAPKITFIFGVRDRSDEFSGNEIIPLQEMHDNFEEHLYFSREQELKAYDSGYTLYEHRGYVTDWITQENISEFQEFYICGSPAMVKSAKEKLSALGIANEYIFSEQY